MTKENLSTSRKRCYQLPSVEEFTSSAIPKFHPNSLPNIKQVFANRPWTYEVNATSCSTPKSRHELFQRILNNRWSESPISKFNQEKNLFSCGYDNIKQDKCWKVEIWKLKEGRTEPMLKSLFQKFEGIESIKITLLVTLHLFSWNNSWYEFCV